MTFPKSTPFVVICFGRRKTLPLSRRNSGSVDNSARMNVEKLELEDLRGSPPPVKPRRIMITNIMTDPKIVKITENTSCKTDGTECVALGPPNKTSDTVECKHGDL